MAIGPIPVGEHQSPLGLGGEAGSAEWVEQLRVAVAHPAGGAVAGSAVECNVLNLNEGAI